MDGTLQLAAGRQPSAVVESLRPLIVEGGNILTSGGAISLLQNRYLQWVEIVERALSSFFDSPWVWEKLLSRRWEQILALSSDTPRPHPLINGEAKAQTEHLIAIVDRLETLYVPFELPSGCVGVIPDTNILLHYEFFREIDWARLVGASEVRLVVPLLVIEQLDSQKFARSMNAPRRRARKVLRALRELRKDLPPESPAEVRQGVGLQVLMDPHRYARNPNDDEEILDRAESLASFVGDKLCVATGDHAMELRVVHRGLTFLPLPDDLLLPDPDDDGA